MRYEVEFAPRAARDLRALPREVRERVVIHVETLADDPRRPGARKLAGESNLYRLRVGDYWVIYTVEDDKLVVLILRVRHRREAYRP